MMINQALVKIAVLAKRESVGAPSKCMGIIAKKFIQILYGTRQDLEFWSMVFNNSRKSNELVYLDVNSTRILPRFHAVNTTNTPSPRYDHSMLVYGEGTQQKLYVFGGVIKEKVITNELWCLDMGTMVWTLLSAHDEAPTALPMAVAGHTAHVIGDEMFVFFGYNPFEGFVFRVQIYSFEMKKWRKGDIDSSILGRFGHSSVLFREADKKAMVLIYGGYNAPLSGYSYSISDELILYDPTEQSWWNLGSTGMPPLFRHTAVMLDGIMLIQNDCYSSELLAFDTVCKEWLKIKISDSSQWSSGFTGMMRNDVLKFTQLNATSRQLVPKIALRELMAFAVQPFLSYIKNENPRLQADCAAKPGQSSSTWAVHGSNTCIDIKECNDCLFQKGCGWCENSQLCLSSDTGCADGLQPIVPDVHSVAREERSLLSLGLHCSWFANVETKHICVSLADESMLIEEHNRLQAERLALVSSPPPVVPSTSSSLISSSNGVQVPSTRNLLSTDLASFPLSTSRSQNSSTCPMPCHVHSGCDACVQSQCMWCPSTRRCVAMDTFMVSFPYGQCQSWVTAANTNHACLLDPYDCELQKTCSDCQLVGPRCGWCDDEAGLCPRNRWFFTGEPSCQCNGHSTCTENTTMDRRCRQCADKTRGEHCGLCDFGYYGDPRNGGVCKECQCNGQATLCNPETGDCYCSTKGVTGPHCDKCEPKYIGDPKNGKPCTYELVIDFIFTFKLDGDDAKDKYVNKINFFSTPFKALVDVQFSITCEGESGAKVSINLTTNILEGRPHTKQLMAGQLCTAAGIKRTYSASDPGFAFGSDSNTTFFVKVRDFVTPIKIQISFAQSPPINWVLFFVIFAACFIVLLVVAGLLWMIKLRVEWYRNIRRRHDEIEEMASRPFASVQLELTSDSIHALPAPISIEPCGNYQSGIYTLVVRLPTGGRPYTPYGASGLAVASSLCELTHSQLALLQPEADASEQQRNRKSALRRFLFRN
uniref:Laminin EGF-like domain-containing protein n=1 Tax=Ditylenchus dipsaci TaxID=166011 RepID=A0A915E013_9BILA